MSETGNNPPNFENYCCVHQDYIIKAETELLWNTVKTEFEESNNVLSVLSIVRQKGDSSGVIAGNFRATASHGRALTHQDADYFGGFEFELDEQYMLSADEDIVKMSYASGTELETEIDIFEVRNDNPNFSLVECAKTWDYRVKADILGEAYDLFHDEVSPTEIYDSRLR